MYLDYAELQALNEKTMTMREWVNELDYFIKMNRKDVLQTKGEVELHYIESTNKLKKLAEKNNK